MVIDTSALVAILLGEPEAARLCAAILAADSPRVGAPSLVEATAVMLARKGPQGQIALDALLQRFGIAVAPLTDEGAAYARSAYARFGKGVGSPGVLNFGDCLAYGVAASLAARLLFVGEDFPKTDIDAAPY
jgi:ribonuclease VapC